MGSEPPGDELRRALYQRYRGRSLAVSQSHLHPETSRPRDLATSLRPAPDRFDLVVIAHEGDDVARGVADQRVGHLGLIRVDAVLRRRFPRPEDGHLAADVA